MVFLSKHKTKNQVLDVYYWNFLCFTWYVLIGMYFNIALSKKSTDVLVLNAIKVKIPEGFRNCNFHFLIFELTCSVCYCFCSVLSLSRGSQVTLSYFSRVDSAFLWANSLNAGREFFEGAHLDYWFCLSSGNIISVLLPYKQHQLM